MHTHGTHSHMCTHACGRHMYTHAYGRHPCAHTHTRLCPALREGKGVRDPHSLAPGGGAVGAVPPAGPRAAGRAPARHTAAARTDQGTRAAGAFPGRASTPRRPLLGGAPSGRAPHLGPAWLPRPPSASSPRPTGESQGQLRIGDPSCGGLGVRGPGHQMGAAGARGPALSRSLTTLTAQEGAPEGAPWPLPPRNSGRQLPAPFSAACTPLLQVASGETAPGLPFHLRPGGFSHRSWVPSPQAAPRRAGRADADPLHVHPFPTTCPSLDLGPEGGSKR